MKPIKIEILIPDEEIKSLFNEILTQSIVREETKNINNTITINKNSAELLTIREVATRLKTTKQRVYELIKYGHMQALKLGDLKVSITELENFIANSQGKDFTDLNNVVDLYQNPI